MQLKKNLKQFFSLSFLPWILFSCSSSSHDQLFFALMDENQDHFISKDEWKKNFSTMDENKDSQITFDEYQAFQKYKCKCGHE